MNIKHSLSSNSKSSFNYSLLLKYSASFLGGLGLISTGLFWIQPQAQATGDTLVIPDNSTLGIVPKPFTATTPTNNSKPLATPKTELSPPKITPPASSVKPASSLIIPQVQPTEVAQPSTIETGKNNFIDTNQYSTSSVKPSAPPTVVLKERSTGCQTIADNGQLRGGECGATVVTKSSSPFAPIVAANSRSRRNLLTNPPSSQVRITRYTPLQPRPVHQSQVVSLKPIEMQGVKIALAPVPKYNRATVTGNQVRPVTRKTDLLFPLSIPAKITSNFGWRVHPIAQTARMHQGTDIGAPIGTPVLAAYGGEVASADWSGGYGLMVVLRHLEGSQESRYAHLSEIYVQPGEWVEQGTVIGRVGSTGYSTGPHLHFEWRHLTAQGWVAVDAGLHLEFALENLIQTMQTAQNNNQHQG
jgi:murein DD-endopeptidase MepM/ murein hydrolase activator NlpD